jgi:SnoaL-like domain
MSHIKSIFASAAVAFASHSFASTAAPLSPVGEPEAAKVISVVSSIPMAVDLAAYDLAERAFAPRIVVDYTSLWGGQPNTMTPAELMTAWRGIVPGFTATWHELSNVKATVSGPQASATAFVDGRHWLDGQLWRPVATTTGIWKRSTANGKSRECSSP